MQLKKRKSTAVALLLRAKDSTGTALANDAASIATNTIKRKFSQQTQYFLKTGLMVHTDTNHV